MEFQNLQPTQSQILDCIPAGGIQPGILPRKKIHDQCVLLLSHLEISKKCEIPAQGLCVKQTV